MRPKIAISKKQTKNLTTPFLKPTASLLAATLLLAIGGQTSRAGGSGYDILYTDSQAAILKADPISGGPIVVAQGQKLVQPLGIVLGTSGEIFITDTGCSAVLGYNPKNGTERVVASGGILGTPFGIAGEPSGTILIANGQALVRVDPKSGAKTIASAGQSFLAPIAVTVAADGSIFVADALGAVIRVNPVSGQQTPVTSGNLLHRPQGIAVSGADIYVTDVATADGNFGIGRITHINAQTGAQTVVSEGGNLVGPVGIVLAPNGHLIVGDPYTINDQSVNLFDGAVLSIDAATGAQTLTSRGQGNFVNPRGVVLVPTRGAQ